MSPRLGRGLGLLALCPLLVAAKDPGHPAEWLFLGYQMLAVPLTALNLLALGLFALTRSYASAVLAHLHAWTGVLVYAPGLLLCFHAFRATSQTLLALLVLGTLAAVTVGLPLWLHRRLREDAC